jgi:hypothetical protein
MFFTQGYHSLRIVGETFCVKIKIKEDRYIALAKTQKHLKHTRINDRDLFGPV